MGTLLTALSWIAFIGFLACIVMMIVSKTRKMGHTKKWGLGIAGCLIAFIVFMSIPYKDESTTSHDSAPPSDPGISQTSSSPAQEKQWVEIKSWSDSGIKNTEDFIISSEYQYRLNWEAFDSGGIFQIYVEDKNGTPVDVAANVQNVAKDVSYIRIPAGTYHLKINSANTKWKVTLEQEK